MKKRYLKMLSGMTDPGGPCDWSLYVLRCGDGSLYTGIAKDVAARLGRHQAGKGAAYTKTHLPVDLVYEEKALTRSQALVREAEIKRWPRRRKEDLIGRIVEATSAARPVRPPPRRRRP